MTGEPMNNCCPEHYDSGEYFQRLAELAELAKNPKATDFRIFDTPEEVERKKKLVEDLANAGYYGTKAEMKKEAKAMRERENGTLHRPVKKI
jgi:hypothetical protein